MKSNFLIKQDRKVINPGGGLNVAAAMVDAVLEDFESPFVRLTDDGPIFCCLAVSTPITLTRG